MNNKNLSALYAKKTAYSLLQVGGTLVLIGAVAVFAPAPAFAATGVEVNLGTAGSYSVVAGTTVTNTGSTTMAGDLGLYPGSSVTGFPPGIVSGATNVNNTAAIGAKSDTTTAYLNAAGQSPATQEGVDLAGLTLNPGIYSVPAGASNLTGTLTLNGQGDPSAVFIFQMPSTLITSSASKIVLTNSANPCNIFWQVTSSATLGTSSSFQGTVLALTSITAKTSAVVNGRLLARDGAVTLDANVITNPVCLVSSSTSTTTTTTTTSGTGAGGTSQLTVPAAHTGEPWSGWPWWVGMTTLGTTGMFLLRPRLRRLHHSR
ncbi:MAG: ice-binding family protein [Ferrimicrobium sp.]